MAQNLGLAIAGVQLGLETILVRPSRSIGSFTAQVTLEEEHSDELEITDHPVEMGAKISDHAYMRPSELVIKCGWSDSPSYGNLLSGLVGGLVTQTVAGINSIISGTAPNQQKDTYQKLLDLQKKREPFTVVTGKRTYANMLVKSIKTTTNKETENALIATIVLRQVLLVTTQVLAVGAPVAAQASPETTAATTQQGQKSLTPAPNFNTDAAKRSISWLTF
jgi:hypothetical protein